MQEKIVLASGSPRRRELLAQAGIPFEAVTAGADETFAGSPEETVRTLSRRKALAAAALYPGRTVLAADTIVYCRGRVLGKPKTSQEAGEMLQILSGGWHEVYTGVCVLRQGQERCECSCTRVHFVALRQEEIEAYIATGEPMDKAGAYAIQGGAARFIDRIEGSPTNVIGLPMALVCSMLEA